MTIREFLEKLAAFGVEVWDEGEKLRCKGPKSILTPEVHAELKNRKQEILAFLRAGVLVNCSVVPIQSKGNRVPFFGVPGHNGDIFCYVPLARRLGEGQPFYGLQPPGFDGECPPIHTVPELAAHFVRALRKFLPDGPYLLGGYCAGGTVAFEVAQQLVASGADVPLLTVFQSPFPTAYSGWRQFIRGKLQYIRDTMRRKKEPIPPKRGRQATQGGRDLKAMIEDATIAGVKAYRPGIFPGPIDLVMASSRSLRQNNDLACNWRGYARKGYELFIGPDGCDGSNMLREPFVGVFADYLARRLDQILPEKRITAAVLPHCSWPECVDAVRVPKDLRQKFWRTADPKTQANSHS